MKSITVSKPDPYLRGTIRLPSSKSICNRLLMIRALSGSGFSIGNLSDAADTRLLFRLLDAVRSSNPQGPVTELDAANAGTVMRFLTAFLAMQRGKWMLTGTERMKQRPIGVLTNALRGLGASIDFLAKPGYPPLLITGRPLTGNELTLDTTVSSQFTSALLLIAPYLREGLTLHLKGNPVSESYSDMTLRLMELFGARVRKMKTKIKVSPGIYQAVEMDAESDWSAAAFWYEAAVFASEADLVLLGLQKDSLQGDSILPEIYENFGIRTRYIEGGIRLTKFSKRIDGFYFDFTRYPDIAQPVIATCAGLGIRGRFEGVQSLRIKETDRLKAIKNEFGKLGFEISYSSRDEMITVLEIKPLKPEFKPGCTFDSYDDHRTAMILAPLAFRLGSLRIINPDVVNKSYPRFWEHLRTTGFEIH